MATTLSRPMHNATCPPLRPVVNGGSHSRIDPARVGRRLRFTVAVVTTRLAVPTVAVTVTVTVTVTSMVAPMITVTVTVTITAMIAITVASMAAITVTITITITVVAMGMAARRIVPGAVAVACVATTVARLRACRPILAIPVPLTQRRRLAGFRFGPLRTRLLAAEIVLPPLGRGLRLLLAQVELQRVRCGHEPRFLHLAAAVAGVTTSGALVSRQRLEAELRPGPTGRGRGEHVLRVVFAALHKAAALWEARLQPSAREGE